MWFVAFPWGLETYPEELRAEGRSWFVAFPWGLETVEFSKYLESVKGL